MRIAVLFLFVGLIMTSCESYLSGPMKDRVNGWASQTGFTASANLIFHDVSVVKAAIGRGDTASAKTDCVVLGDDVQSANGNLPTPYEPMTLDLANGYSDLYGAAISCYHDGSASNIQKLKIDLNSMNNALSKITQARQLGSNVAGKNL